MTKKKNTDPEKKAKADRHKASQQVRIRITLIPALQTSAKRNASTVPEEVNRAIVEYLERKGLWPPPGNCTSTKET